ncbi:MAG TPA: hypothetical protein VM925_25880, partial [Labilithrix sp.]|nr:hypothetical protein [Labilithrix sp.]
MAVVAAVVADNGGVLASRFASLIGGLLARLVGGFFACLVGGFFASLIGGFFTCLVGGLFTCLQARGLRACRAFVRRWLRDLGIRRARARNTDESDPKDAQRRHDSFEVHHVEYLLRAPRRCIRK